MRNCWSIGTWWTSKQNQRGPGGVVYKNGTVVVHGCGRECDEWGLLYSESSVYQP